MPTYVCQIEPGQLDAEQKNALAGAICKRHHEATGAPIHFVQVIIDENKSRTRYLGNAQAKGYIWVRGDIRAGRSEATREQLIKNIAADASRIANIPIDDVWVYVCNLAPTDMVEFGEVLPRPGAEQKWFDNLPEKLRNRLSELSKETKFTL